MSSVTAIVVSYETRDLLGRCLAALREEQVATVVVDNASRDGSASFVREQFPEATLVALDQNVGFAAGCNAGAAHAATPFLLLVNPDAAPRPGAVAALVDCCRTSERTAGASPRIVDEGGRETVSVLGYPTRWWRGAPPVTSFSGESARGTATSGTLRGQFAVGAALLLRRSAFDEVGGFDPGFFLFYEEVDLCRRLEAAGWSLERCPTPSSRISEAPRRDVTGARSTPTSCAAISATSRSTRAGALRPRRASSSSRRCRCGTSGRAERAARGYAEGVRWLAHADLDEITAPAPAMPGQAQP